MKNYIQKFQQIPTPFYFYDMDLLRQTLEEVRKESSRYGFHVHYAMKANANPVILKEILAYGLGADCVSGGEVQRAVDCGFEGKAIVFAGVGKSDEEIRTGLRSNISCFNCESMPEIEVINQLAGEMNRVATIALRINPNVDAKTHHYITTGLEENKFGINPWEFEKVLELLSRMEHIRLSGIHFHIGSQITDLTVFQGLAIRVNEIKAWFAGKGIRFAHLNVGGGFGIDYRDPNANPIPDFAPYFAVFNDLVQLDEGQELHFELGRAIVAQCGSLVSRVLYIKEGVQKKFAILDAGMNDLIRPALYQAYHKIENWTMGAETTGKYDVVGPICESSDTFGKEVDLPETKRGDFLVMRSAGAYGEVMASTYNIRKIPESVFSDQI
jgi:diaminopimelate decarboxylase